MTSQHAFALVMTLALGTVSVPVLAQETNTYEAAVAARRDDRPAEAKQLLETWLEVHPGDLDARLQLAYVDLALGNLDVAESGFRFVLFQAPDYADAKSGLDLVAERRSARQDDWQGQLRIEGAVSDLGRGDNDWSEGAADVAIKAGRDSIVGGRMSHHRRFGLIDFEFGGRLSFRASENVWLRAHAGVTPNADFRPKLELGGGIDLRASVDTGTVITLDGTYQQFPTQNVFTVSPGVVQYLAGGKTWITLRGIGVTVDNSKLQVGALLRGDFAPAPDWRLFAGGSNGPDTDLGVVTRASSVFAGWEAPLADGFGLTGSIARDWREAGSNRTEFRLGLRARY